MKHILASVVVSSMLLTACGGGGSSDETDSTPSTSDRGLSTVSMTTPFAISDDCPNGGIEVSTGIDDNGNGLLDSNEIDNTQSVCHGSNGNSGSSSLIATHEELAGANCANGGLRIDIGMDSNASGVLDASEITTTQYVCDGKDSGDSGTDGLSSLIDMSDEPAGGNCANGGILITTGIDANSSGVLDPSEVSNSRYICNSEGGTVVEGSDFYQCDDNDLCMIYGHIDRGFTLTADKTWLMTGDVYVGSGNRFILSEEDAANVQANGVTLTIEPGTEIQALPYTTLVVTRGSKLMAEGTSDKPINFSAYNEFQNWSGIRLQGLAEFWPYSSEADISCLDVSIYCNYSYDYGFFGGHINDDNSGVLQYVSISGASRSLTLASTGSGTIVKKVQLSGEQQSRALVAFGGTTNISHVSTESTYSGMVFTNGYKGNLQYAILKQSPSSGSYASAISLSGEATELSAANILVIGFDDSGYESGYDSGYYSASAFNPSKGILKVYNSIIHGDRFGSCLDGGYYTDDGAWVSNSLADYANLINGISQNCHIGNGNYLDYAYITIDSSGALVTEETVSVTNWQPVDNGSGFVFDNTNYVGAVAPGTAIEDAWWYGWTIEGSMDELETPEYLLPPDPTDFSTLSFVSCNDDESICTLEGVIDTDIVLSADKEWRINGLVTVGAGNAELSDTAAVEAAKAAGITLTIQPGVHVQAYGDGVLLVTRGSKLMAEGTADSPITFSSVQDEDFDGLGEWGGVVIQGFAPQYGAGNTGICGTDVCNVDSYVFDRSSYFGGLDQADNSGVIKYVRIAEAGVVAGPNDEMNGLTLQGVGHGTTIEYIQVHNNMDDGIEWFGGTVNVKYAVLTGNNDDDIDFDEGYQGNIQYAIIRKNPDQLFPFGSNDPRGIEANSSDEEYVPQTEGALANITLVGAAMTGGNYGMRLRGSLTTRIYNTAIVNWEDCIRVDDSDHDEDDSTAKIPSDVTLVNVIGECSDSFYTKRNADSEVGTVGAAAIDLTDAAAMTATTEFTVTSWEPVDNGSGFAFENTNYAGAVAPGTAAADAWWAGWTIPGSLDGIGDQDDAASTFATH